VSIHLNAVKTNPATPATPTRRVPDQATPSVGPDGRNRPEYNSPGSRTRRSVVDGGARPARAERCALTAVLTDLVDGKEMVDLEIQIGGVAPRPAGEVITHVPEACRGVHAGTVGIFWGQVDGNNPGKFGVDFLQLRHAADRVSMLVDEAVLAKLGIPHLEGLENRDVVANSCSCWLRNSRRNNGLQDRHAHSGFGGAVSNVGAGK